MNTMDVKIAASIEAVAKEIAAAAGSYQRMPNFQQDLAAGIEVLMQRLIDAHRVFVAKRDMAKIIVDYHNADGDE
jgi:hypothetical protein